MSSDHHARLGQEFDAWLTAAMTSLHSALYAVLDLDAGLADAQLPGYQNILVHALHDVLDLDAGLNRILPTSPPTPDETRPANLHQAIADLFEDSDTDYDRVLSRLALPGAYFGGGAEADLSRIDTGIDRSRQALRLFPPGHPLHALYLQLLALGLFRRSEVVGTTDGLDEATQLLERARDLLGGSPHLEWVQVNEILALVQLRNGSFQESAQIGRVAQYSYARHDLSDDTIVMLQAELAGLSGGVRLATLIRLGQALVERYWRSGQGLPERLPDLNAAIDAMDEAYGYMRAGDDLRDRVASWLGMLLGMRHVVHAEAEQDRETGIRMLEEALATDNLPKALQTASWVQLGQLYLSRVITFFKSPGAAMGLMSGQVPSDVAASAGRAADCFREVIADGVINDQGAKTAAERMLAVAEMVQTIIGGAGVAGLDIRRPMETLVAMQDLQDRFTRSATPGPGFHGTESSLAFSYTEAMLMLVPLDRPVPVVEQAEPGFGPVSSRPPSVAPAPMDRDQLRRALFDRLSGPDATEPIWTCAAALLLPAAPALAVDIVDEVVAMAGMVVDTEDDNDGSAAVDWFVLAVALHLRDRLDQGSDHADRLTGAECLVAAVRKIPVDHPAASTMLRALGAFLEENSPFGGVLDVVADDFAGRLDAAITASAAKDAAELASLHALRSLCRAVRRPSRT